MRLSRSTMGLAIGAIVIAATTAAAPHITPMVVLTEQADVIRRTLDDADDFFVRTVEIGRGRPREYPRRGLVRARGPGV